MWTTRLTVSAGPSPQTIAKRLDVTRTLIVGSSYLGSRLFALDRATGRGLWRRETPSEDRYQESRVPATWEYDWRPAGSVLIGGSSQEVVILYSRKATRTLLAEPDRPRPRGRYTRTTDTPQLEAVAAANGQRLWRRSLPSHTDRDRLLEPLGTRGGILVLARTAGKPMYELWDALAGRRLDPKTAAGRAVLRRAEAKVGSRYVPVGPIGYYRTAYRLDLRTGSLRELRECSPLSGDPQCLLRVGSRILAHRDFDDGGAGHSALPKDVVCADLNGRRLWVFPPPEPNRKPVLCPSELGNYYRVWRSLYLPAAGVVIAESDQQYGVSFRNGAVLWKNDWGPSFNARTAFRGGCFATAPGAREKPLESRLAFVDGRTGARRWLTQLPRCDDMKLVGERLVVLTGQEVRAYSAPALLALNAQ